MSRNEELHQTQTDTSIQTGRHYNDSRTSIQKRVVREGNHVDKNNQGIQRRRTAGQNVVFKLPETAKKTEDKSFTRLRTVQYKAK